MIRTALRTIFAHKLRLVLTAISVMIGVAFIAGTFIFTDTINQTFTDLFDDQFAGQDVIVQAESEFDVVAGSLAASGTVAVGAAAAVSVINKDVHAFLGSTAATRRFATATPVPAAVPSGGSAAVPPELHAREDTP